MNLPYQQTALIFKEIYISVKNIHLANYNRGVFAEERTQDDLVVTFKVV